MSYFNPHRMPELPAGRRTAARLQLEQVVARSAQSARRSKSAVIAAGAVAVVVGAGAAAYAVAGFQPVTDKTQARCYTVADNGSSRFTTVAAAGRSGSTAQVQDALSICAALFRQGFLTAGGPGINRHADGKPDHPVPRLAICTMRDATASVFPGSASTCARLGLREASRM
jgi:hypothetical protein